MGGGTQGQQQLVYTKSAMVGGELRMEGMACGVG